LYLGLRLQASQVEHVTIGTVMDGDTSLAVLKCYSEHHGKEDNEQKWGQDTALFGAIGDIEVLRHLAILNNSRSHAFVE